MNEHMDGVGESISALCVLLTELTATVGQQGKRMEVIVARMSEDVKALLDGMFVILNEGRDTPQPEPRTWKQHVRTAIGILGWVGFGMLLMLGLAGMAMQYLVTQ